MGWASTKMQCQCNDTQNAAAPCISSKQILPICTPIITAVRSTCGARRMFVSAIILIFLLAAIYWVSLPHQQANSLHRPMRTQPQPSRNSAPERTEAAETIESQ